MDELQPLNSERELYTGGRVYVASFYTPAYTDFASNAEVRFARAQTPSDAFVRLSVYINAGKIEGGAMTLIEESAWKVPCSVGQPIPGDVCTCCGERLRRVGQG
ncbi:hypothetical protein [Deinococcus yavapaiensis]|uniref:Uncharacterized protein n=1 Tax=Deinococcus yavapaiensis KR-236 TaxID=694435 RepID=A0A318S4L3_9DEIO|nr:hypothetical protein [Deinococcus yavapaiensis]PYE47924.1 hypothetical protein DES52_1362 [Deinococcus yavapaiensis KR-236]